MLVKVRNSLYSGSGKSKLNIVLNVLIVIVFLAILAEIIFGSLYSGVYIIQSSMRPTIIGATDQEDKYDGDYVYVRPGAKPDYGDIVVVFKDDDTTIIKRVIAFGGDRVKLIEGKLYIKYKGAQDFVLIEEKYVSPENNVRRDKNNFPTVNGLVLPEGHLVDENSMFLLGDNRDYSLDSRESGDFAVSRLYGVVTDWSLRYKKAITSIHKFFKYDVPLFFGVDVKIKGIDY